MIRQKPHLLTKNTKGVPLFLATVSKRFQKELDIDEGDIAYQIVCEEYYKFK